MKTLAREIIKNSLIFDVHMLYRIIFYIQPSVIKSVLVSLLIRENLIILGQNIIYIYDLTFDATTESKSLERKVGMNLYS